MSKGLNKRQLLAPRLPLLDEVMHAEEKLDTHDGLLLLTFWGSKGCGRTTFLNVVKEKFSSSNEVGITGIWDASDSKAFDLSRSISKAIDNQGSNHKLVLIDNLDALLKKDDQGFFEFENDTILKLVERGDTLIITSSQIEISFWQEYDVRERQKNFQLVPLKLDELEEIINDTDIDNNLAYQMTFGHPKILDMFLTHPNWTEKEISDHAQRYFLEDLPEETREVARMASLLPAFNIFILREIQKENNKMEQSDMLTWYNDQINELTKQWIVQFDTQVGAYCFTDHAVRRLIARDFAINFIREFHRIQKIAANYYQEEAKGISYLPQIFVSAIYHLAQTQKTLAEHDTGDYCLSWIKDMRDVWRGARWE